MFPLSPDRLAFLLKAPPQNVATYWPMIEGALARLNLDSPATCIAALATIRVECPPFKPIHEYGSDALHEKMYGPDSRHGKNWLGNLHSGDGAKYAGRGFIQLTGEANYAHYGKAVGADLIDDPNDPNDDLDPDKALDARIAAAIFAVYFQEKHIAEAAAAGDWQKVRKLVNGGLNGWDDFSHYVAGLEAALQQAQAAQG